MVEVDLMWLIGFGGAGALAVYALVRYRIAQVRDVARELYEMLDAVVAADMDSKVSDVEAALIVKEAKELLAALRAVFMPRPPAV